MLVHDVLVHGGAEHRQLLSLKLTEFFTTVCSDLPSPGRATTPLPSKLTISQQFSGVFVSFKRVLAVLMLEEPLLGGVESGLKKQSVETMLRVVQHLRLQQRPSSGYRVMFSNRLSYTWQCNAVAAYTRTCTLYLSTDEARRRCGRTISGWSWTTCSWRRRRSAAPPTSAPSSTPRSGAVCKGSHFLFSVDPCGAFGTVFN